MFFVMFLELKITAQGRGWCRIFNSQPLDKKTWKRKSTCPLKPSDPI